MTRAGSPHSDTLGSQPASRLPEAYRRPPRPSSAPDAKASTERPKKQTHNTTQTNTTTITTQRTKILASTIQITTNPPTHARPTPRTKKGPARRAGPQPGRTAPEPDSMPPTTHPPHRTRGGTGDRRPRPPGHPGGTRTRSSCSQPKQPHRTRPDHPTPPHTMRGAVRRSTEPRAAE